MNLSLTRRYRFSASHRLDTPRFSEAENRRVYGKCNNPYGHGHNYALEVTVTGPVNSETGMIANLADLDPFVEREVIEPFDHKYLNEEVADLRVSRADNRERLPRNLPPPRKISKPRV